MSRARGHVAAGAAFTIAGDPRIPTTGASGSVLSAGIRALTP